jgi:hypothetical protein
MPIGRVFNLSFHEDWQAQLSKVFAKHHSYSIQNLNVIRLANPTGTTKIAETIITPKIPDIR